MSQFRPVLVIFCGPSFVYPGKFSVTCEVQVWRESVCITTVPIANFVKADGPDLEYAGTVEQFATHMTRYVSRLCDEELFERIRTKSVHHWRDMEAQFPAPTTVQP